VLEGLNYSEAAAEEKIRLLIETLDKVRGFHAEAQRLTSKARVFSKLSGRPLGHSMHGTY
jgi:hypothetical protein